MTHQNPLDLFYRHTVNLYYKLHQITKLKWFPSCLAVAFAQSIEPRYNVENEDVVGAAPTGDAATTSEWLVSSKSVAYEDVAYIRGLTVVYLR